MERNRMELLPGVFFTFVRLKDAPQGCFRAALLRQLDRGGTQPGQLSCRRVYSFSQ